MSDETAKRSLMGTTFALLVLVSLVYVLSPLPMELVVMTLPDRFGDPAREVLNVLYRPLDWAYNRSELVRWFYDWQYDLIL